MIYFSYNECMDCEQNGENNGVKRIGEEIVKYEIKNSEKTIDKSPIIEVIKDKKELKNFLDEFFDLDNLIGNYDIQYCNKIKAKTDKNTNNVIISKIQNKEIFIVIKEIEKIDINIAYKMFEHSSNLIKQWNQNKGLQKTRNPIVIPIVIYTGKQKWENSKNKKYNKINYIEYSDNKIKFSYNMLKINELDNLNLKNKESKVLKTIMKIKNI